MESSAGWNASLTDMGRTNQSGRGGSTAHDHVLRDRATGEPIEVASLESRVVSGRLVERATNQTLQTSAVDSVVLSGALVDRVSGQVVQTRPATRIFTLSDGPYALYVPARARKSNECKEAQRDPIASPRIYA